MKQANIIALVTVLLTVICNTAFGYDPYTGCFQQQDPVGTGPRMVSGPYGPRFIGLNGPTPPNPNAQTVQGIPVAHIQATISHNPKTAAAFNAIGASQYDDGMNAYQYTGSNPVNRVDPMGLKFSYAASEFWYKQMEQIIPPSWPAMARLINDGRGNWSLGSYSGQISLVSNEALICLFWLESKFNSKADGGFGRGMGYGIGQMTTPGAQEVNRYNKFGPYYPNDKHDEIYMSIGELANGFRYLDWRDRIKGDVYEQISSTIAYLLTLARRDGTNDMREILKKYGPGDASYSEYADVIIDCEKCVKNSQRRDIWGVPLPANSSEKECKNCLELADEQRAKARTNNSNR